MWKLFLFVLPNPCEILLRCRNNVKSHSERRVPHFVVCVFMDASCQFLVQRGSWLPPPHPAHLQYHISTLIVTPLPITHVIPHATLPCPCARPAAQKGLENKDRARCHWYHVLMSLEMNNDRAKVYLAKQKELFPKRSLSHTSGKMILCYQISFKKAS